MGVYNVGLVAFRRTPDGLTALRWWRERCLEWCFDRIEAHRYGDQKYLDDWPERFAGVAVLEHRGGGAGPWNVGSHRVHLRAGVVFVDAAPLLFYHFSLLRALTPWLWDTGLWL
jgi:hypothetical protein